MLLIGEYHRDFVLSLNEDQRKQMDLPNFREDAKIENEIFGWFILCGKERIECRSEDEARYIYAFWSYHWNDFWVPTNDKYLSKILPRLLNLKKKHDEIINLRCSLYSSRKASAEIRRRIYLGVTLRTKEIEQEEEEEVEDDNEFEANDEDTLLEESLTD